MWRFIFCIIIDKTGGDDIYGYDEDENDDDDDDDDGDDDDDDVDKPSPRVRGHMSTCHTPPVSLIDFTTLPFSIQCNSM